MKTGTCFARGVGGRRTGKRARVFTEFRCLSLAKIMSGREINSLQSLFNPRICYKISLMFGFFQLWFGAPR
jgi:hypothetical protein